MNSTTASHAQEGVLVFAVVCEPDHVSIGICRPASGALAVHRAAPPTVECATAAIRAVLEIEPAGDDDRNTIVFESFGYDQVVASVDLPALAARVGANVIVVSAPEVVDGLGLRWGRPADMSDTTIIHAVARRMGWPRPRSWTESWLAAVALAAWDASSFSGAPAASMIPGELIAPVRVAPFEAALYVAPQPEARESTATMGLSADAADRGLKRTPELLTVDDLAAALRISRSAAYRLAAEVPGARIRGVGLRFRHADVEAYIEKFKRSTDSPPKRLRSGSRAGMRVASDDDEVVVDGLTRRQLKEKAGF